MVIPELIEATQLRQPNLMQPNVKNHEWTAMNAN